MFVKFVKCLWVGIKVLFGDGWLIVIVIKELEYGGCIVEFLYDGIFLEVFESLGEMLFLLYIYEKLEDCDCY